MPAKKVKINSKPVDKPASIDDWVAARAVEPVESEPPQTK